MFVHKILPLIFHHDYLLLIFFGAQLSSAYHFTFQSSSCFNFLFQFKMGPGRTKKATSEAKVEKKTKVTTKKGRGKSDYDVKSK